MCYGEEQTRSRRSSSSTPAAQPRGFRHRLRSSIRRDDKSKSASRSPPSQARIEQLSHKKGKAKAKKAQGTNPFLLSVTQPPADHKKSRSPASLDYDPEFIPKPTELTRNVSDGSLAHYGSDDDEYAITPEKEGKNGYHFATMDVNPHWAPKNRPRNVFREDETGLGIEYEGNRIVEVKPGSQAAEIGLRIGDIILGFDHRPLPLRNVNDTEYIYSRIQRRLHSGNPFSIQVAYLWGNAASSFRPGLYKILKPIPASNKVETNQRKESSSTASFDFKDLQETGREVRIVETKVVHSAFGNSGWIRGRIKQPGLTKTQKWITLTNTRMKRPNVTLVSRERMQREEKFKSSREDYLQYENETEYLWWSFFEVACQLRNKKKYQASLQVHINEIRIKSAKGILQALGIKADPNDLLNFTSKDDWVVSVAVLSEHKNVLDYHRTMMYDLLRNSNSPEGPGSPAKVRDFEDALPLIPPRFEKLATDRTMRSAFPQRYKESRPSGLSLDADEIKRAHFLRIRLLDATPPTLSKRYSRSVARLSSARDVLGYGRDAEHPEEQASLRKLANEEKGRWKILGEVEVNLKKILKYREASASEWIGLGIKDTVAENRDKKKSKGGLKITAEVNVELNFISEEQAKSLEEKSYALARSVLKEFYALHNSKAMKESRKRLAKAEDEAVAASRNLLQKCLYNSNDVSLAFYLLREGSAWRGLRTWDSDSRKEPYHFVVERRNEQSLIARHSVKSVSDLVTVIFEVNHHKRPNRDAKDSMRVLEFPPVRSLPSPPVPRRQASESDGESPKSSPKFLTRKETQHVLLSPRSVASEEVEIEESTVVRVGLRWTDRATRYEAIIDPGLRRLTGTWKSAFGSGTFQLQAMVEEEWVDAVEKEKSKGLVLSSVHDLAYSAGLEEYEPALRTNFSAQELMNATTEKWLEILDTTGMDEYDAAALWKEIGRRRDKFVALAEHK